MQAPMRTQTKNKFWNFRNATDGEPELLLYSEIADTTWWGDEVTPLQFVTDLRNATASASKITIRINSGGGDVFAANAIASNLRDVSAQGKIVTCKIDGLCASAATLVAMACDTIMIPSGGYMMIHNASTGLLGYYTEDDLLQMADTLATINEGIINTYTARTGLGAKACQKLMDAETWMTGKEAVEKGFADELTDEPVNIQPMDAENVVVNGVKFKFAANSHLPDSLRKQDNTKGGTNLEINNANELRAAYPDLVNEIEGTARDAGATAERARLQAIDSLPDIDPAYLAEVKYGAEALSPETVAYNALRNGKTRKTNPLAALAADKNTVNTVPGAAEPPAASESEKKKAYADGVETRIRAHFGKKGDDK